MDKLMELLLEEEARNFEGWDFSYLDNRMIGEELPWDYKAIVLSYLEETSQLLDMGTGGGEFLLSLGHNPHLTSVSEAYALNFELCNKKLKPLGIKVLFVENDNYLPMKSQLFDLIINRHENFDVNEVQRLLKPGGYFITQQVGVLNNCALSKEMDETFVCSNKANDLETNIELLKAKNFKIIKSEEFFPKLKFMDIGALVYFMKIINWEFPKFDVKNDYAKLVELNDRVVKDGYLETQEHRFLIVAKLG